MVLSLFPPFLMPAQVVQILTLFLKHGFLLPIAASSKVDISVLLIFTSVLSFRFFIKLYGNYLYHITGPIFLWWQDSHLGNFLWNRFDRNLKNLQNKREENITKVFLKTKQLVSLSFFLLECILVYIVSFY